MFHVYVEKFRCNKKDTFCYIYMFLPHLWRYFVILSDVNRGAVTVWSHQVAFQGGEIPRFSAKLAVLRVNTRWQQRNAFSR